MKQVGRLAALLLLFILNGCAATGGSTLAPRTDAQAMALSTYRIAGHDQIFAFTGAVFRK